MSKKIEVKILFGSLLLSVLFFTVISWQIGCKKSDGEPANIILISIDTLRADHLGIYGYGKNTSPNIDRLAKNGIMFTQAHTTAPWTLPAHMSLFSGLPPSLHGVEMDNQRLDKTINTLPEILKSNGYTTAGLVTLPYTMGKYGFSRGFDFFEEHLKEPSKQVTDRALTWLRSTKPAKFFLFLHYCDVHWPYSPPKKYAHLFQLNTQAEGWNTLGRYMRLRKFVNPRKEMPEKIRSIVVNLYDGEIRYVDHQIKRLVHFLQKNHLADNTVIVITSDHGEEFNEHHSFGHGHSFYAELTRIPLIIHHPARIRPGQVIQEPVSLLDIPNTLLRLAGIRPEKQFTGYAVDLGSYFDVKKAILYPHRKIIMETTWAGPKRLAIIQNQRKYFNLFRFQTPGRRRKWVPVPAGMFDLTNDPTDRYNLLTHEGKDPGVAKQVDLFEKNLKQFTTDHAQGLRLIFKNSNPRHQSPVKLQAMLTFDHPLMGHPFSVNTTKSDQVIMDKNKMSIEINLQLQGDRKTIYIPTSPSHQKLSLKLKQNAVTIFHQYPKIPISGQSIELFADKIQGISLQLQGSIRDPLFHQGRQSKKEIKALKSLGYINETP